MASDPSSPSSPDRRRMLAGLLVAAIGLAGCEPVTPVRAGPPLVFSEVRVVLGQTGITLRQLAPFLREELEAQLGDRFRPGLKGGLTLQVTLTGVLLADRDSGGFFDDDGFGRGRRRFGGGFNIDQLEGRVEVLRGKKIMSSEPLLATRGATFRPPAFDLMPDPDRLRRLAQTYAYWAIRKV
ncbi:MAG: hypothetical protein ACK50Q_14980 [Labrys sp. (in: a-proteobacteria)]|jgi:hypothetical protein